MRIDVIVMDLGYSWDQPARTIAGESFPTNGAFSVADPRTITGKRAEQSPHRRPPSRRWDKPTGAVSASACHDNGGWSVADPRMPGEKENLVAVIPALDATWHRPFTTLEWPCCKAWWTPGISRTRWVVRQRIAQSAPAMHYLTAPRAREIPRGRPSFAAPPARGS